MMKSTSINMGGIFLEQSVKTQSKLTQMIKMLLVAYLVTGILLLILAFLLCKFQLNENQIHLGILVTYILSCFVGSFALGKSIRQRCFLWGMGLGASYALLLTVVTWITERKIQGDLKEFLITYGLCIMAGALGGMLS